MTSYNPDSFPAQSKETPFNKSHSTLQKLLEGNERYMAGKSLHPNQTPEHRIETAVSPNPFATILSCSDSRVPPEIIFDCGIGDLFVIRVAGNILNKEITGSIEYAVEYFGTKLIVVMGHKRCGAVLTAIKGGEFQGSIKSLIEAIQPALEDAKRESGDLADNTVNKNIEMTVKALKSSSPILKNGIQQGNLNIIGAYYDMDNGRVAFNK
jgi:carbonic anhydrase